MSDNKNQLRAVDFDKLWLDKALDDVVEKVERPLPWPEPPEFGPYRTALPCEGCNHASYAIRLANAAIDDLQRFKRRVALWVIGVCAGVCAGVTVMILMAMQ